jgi:hypothetical protein
MTAGVSRKHIDAADIVAAVEERRAQQQIRGHATRSRAQPESVFVARLPEAIYGQANGERAMNHAKSEEIGHGLYGLSRIPHDLMPEHGCQYALIRLGKVVSRLISTGRELARGIVILGLEPTTCGHL